MRWVEREALVHACESIGESRADAITALCIFGDSERAFRALADHKEETRELLDRWRNLK